MLRIGQAELDHIEKQYPGIVASILAFEAEALPPCVHCGSSDTAIVQAGVIGRTINIAVATTKYHLTPNGGPGRYFCNSCEKYFP